MQPLTTVIPIVGEFLILTPRQVAGVVLAMMNEAHDERGHPRNLRLDAERQFPGPSSLAAGDLMANAVELLFSERFIVRDYRDTVDSDWFSLTDKGKAITDAKQMEQPKALLDSGRPLVFVSCGQYTSEEKAIGTKICEIIRRHTEYEPYFAETQRSLKGLSDNILAALERMSGMVVIMHKRGEVKTPTGVHQRASVWIEQEIAIAAALQHAGRDITVVAYAEHGIQREGLRDLLHLNPMPFTTADEVTTDFETFVKGGRFKLTAYTSAAIAEAARTAGPAEDPYEAQITEALDHAYGQGGLQVLSYILSMSMALRPTAYIANRVPEEATRRLIDDAKQASGVAFPIGATSSAVNLEDGFQVTTYPTTDGPRQYREYYRLRHSGLFVATVVSLDDIKEDRQFRESDRYVGFTTLVGTLTRMGVFAAALTRRLRTEMALTFYVYGLANHRIVDDTADQGLTMSEVPVAHEDRVTDTFVGDPPVFEEKNRIWSATVVTHCLRLLNYPATTSVIEGLVRRYQQRVQ